MAPAPRFNGAPSQAVDTPSLCILYVGIQPVLEEHYDRLRIKMQDRVQSRIDKNNAPEAMVKRYTKLMSESVFPAVLLTEDDHIIDGNTRVKAHAARSERYIKAWVLPIAWETADAATREKLLLLSLALNSMNGMPLDETEMRNYANILLKQNAGDEEIMGKTGLSLSKVTMLRHQHLADNRLRNVGISKEMIKTLPDTSLRALGKPNALKLDDDLFTGLFHLTKEAGLKGGAVNSLAASLNEQTSPDSKRERLARERRALDSQILANQGGQSAQMQCDWLRNTLLKLLDKPISAFKETNTEKVSEYNELLIKGIERLQEISEYQLIAQPSTTVSTSREATH
jgi:hypothetical protein